MTESRERLAAVQARMVAAGIDLLAVGPTANMHYLLGFAPHADERLCLLLVSRRAVRLVVPELNREETSAHSDVALVGWADADGPQAALRRALAELPPARSLAVDGGMRADAMLQLLALVAAERTTTAEALLAPLRMAKSAREVEALARAARQADLAMQAAVEACRPGASELDVAWAAEAAFRADGAEEVCFALVASGPNGAHPHHHSGGRRLQRGDAITIDIGASLAGFKSDITRMVFLGEPSKEFLQAHAAVHEANHRAVAAIRPGVTAGEVDRAARNALEAAGYGAYFVHRTGHGLGLEVHEPPWITEGDATVLREGMTFSIEPGVYLPGKFGVRIEDIVVVTTIGARNLTGFDHALVIKDA